MGIITKSLVALFFVLSTTAWSDPDPFTWLEEVESDRALTWVREKNSHTESILTQHPRYQEIYQRTLGILSSSNQLAMPDLGDNEIYNFWQDGTHPRGMWRKTSIESYRTANPEWTTIIDVDALATQENREWAWKGSNCLPRSTRCLIYLSNGGQDATEVREFDLSTNSWVTQNAFHVPEAKHVISWFDENTLLIGTNFGPGSQTESGYPRTVRLWNRGAPLQTAQELFTGLNSDVEVFSSTFFAPNGQKLVLFGRYPTYFETDLHVWNPETRAIRRLTESEQGLPSTANLLGWWKGKLILSLRDDWTRGEVTRRSGSLIAVSMDRLSPQASEVIFEPTATAILGETPVSFGKDFLFLNWMENVKGRLSLVRYENRTWSRTEVTLPDQGAIELVSSNSMSENNGNMLFAKFEDFTTPVSLYEINPGAAPVRLKMDEATFVGSEFVTEQFHATSRDGTQIPYFIVHSRAMIADSNNPTILYGYGGFEISMTPFYSRLSGPDFLSYGGVYVVANIRGGGEFGPTWHQAALMENRQRAFDDFIAVAEDLIARRITSPRHLGIQGGSNGGLLVGAFFTQRPDLINAAVCQVPLLDMLRYVDFPPGASWIGEYGDPRDPRIAEIIARYSPYQNVHADRAYPEILIDTTTRDDRVHPSHARKMAALLESLEKPVLYFENTEGGHGSGVTPAQRAKMRALEYTYLHKQLM